MENFLVYITFHSHLCNLRRVLKICILCNACIMQIFKITLLERSALIATINYHSNKRLQLKHRWNLSDLDAYLLDNKSISQRNFIKCNSSTTITTSLTDLILVKIFVNFKNCADKSTIAVYRSAMFSRSSLPEK